MSNFNSAVNLRQSETYLRSTFNKTEMNPQGMRKKKVVMDIISGQNNIHKRWEHDPSSLQELLAPQPQQTLHHQLYHNKHSKRKVSNLDAYIELILKNGVSMDEFLYLVRNSIDDPYDLEITEYGNIISDKGKFEKGVGPKTKKPKDNGPNQHQLTEIKEYYTISKKGLCHFVNHKPVEFIPLANFIRERETYDEIKSLKFFS
jgi:dynein heavy chain